MRPTRYTRRRRPPWWPEDEPWPPTGRPPWAWHTGRGRFLWRFGLLLALFPILLLSAFALLVWLIATVLHGVEAPPGFFFRGAGLGGVVLILGVVSLFQVGRALRGAAMPIADLMDAAEHIADGDYSRRVPERGPPEVRQLARAFNSMAERLQANDEQRRGLLADVTHELRTPLTVIQGNIEGLIDGVYPADEAHLTPILDETRILSRLIDDLRTLSLAESGALQLKKEPTDLTALASETVASFRAQADAAGVDLAVEASPEVAAVNIDPARVREVLENVIANALRHTTSGRTIRVRCMASDGEDGDRAVILSVDDTGSGIAPEDLPHIFDRFYRAGDSRGMGLGLAIAKDLIEAHGGTIAAKSEVGKGTTIECRLPASPTP